MKRILILNGPNLNLLGKREPTIYGHSSFEDFFQEIKEKWSSFHLEHFQSNHEGLLIDKLHEVGFDWDGIVFNPAAYTHTSVALADAIAAISAPVVEVHISNVASREAFRHHSYTAPNCVGTIMGLGLVGYHLAIEYLIHHYLKS
ncbi:MAG: type II 3-dehydroquinate dehydratase [Saprospiraceae bacterium]|jgi:3-dehydroquinate dehydratase-2